MGKFANTFEMKLADLKADVETKICVFFMKNTKLESAEFSKPYGGLITFTAKRVQGNNRFYVELTNIHDGNKIDVREAFSAEQMIIFLEEIEDYLEEN